MRKDVSYKLRIKKTKTKILLLFFVVFLFIVVNGFFVYLTNINNSYFSFIKKALPFPAFVVGDRVVTVSEYERTISVNKRIYENAYKIDFSNNKENKDLYKELFERSREEAIDNIIMEEVLASVDLSVSSKEINNKYKEITQSLSEDKNVSEAVKFISGLNSADLKKKIYSDLLREKVENNIIKNVKLDILALDTSLVDRDETLDFREDIVKNRNLFFDYDRRYSNKDDLWYKMIDENFVKISDLPDIMRREVKNLSIGELSDVIEFDSNFYIFVLDEEKCYFDGDIAEFLSKQKEGLRIWNFVGY